MKRLFQSLFLSAFLFVPFLSFAQTEGGIEEKGMEYLLFEEIPTVQSSGFFATKATTAPGTSTIIDSVTIENSSARTIAQLLDQNVPGFISTVHEYGSASQSIRGMSADRTIALLDGANIGSRLYSYGHTQFENTPLLGDIKTIEFTKGPGAIMYGSGAIGAFMDIIPKNGTDNKGFFASFDHGFTEELYKTEIGYGANFGANKDLFIYGGIVSAHGVKADKTTWQNPTTPFGGQNFGDAGRFSTWHANFRTDGFAGPAYKLSTNFNWNDFNLKILMEHAQPFINGLDSGSRGTDLSSPVNYNVTDLGVDDMSRTEMAFHSSTALSVLPKYTLKLTDVESLEMALDYQLIQEGQDMNQGSQGTTGINYADYRDQGSEQHIGGKLTAKTTRFNKNSVAFGVSLDRRQFKRNDSFFGGNDVFPDSAPNDGAGIDLTWREFGLFAEDVIAFTDKLTGSIGFRYDEVFYSPASVHRTLGAGDSWMGIPNWKTGITLQNAHNFSQRYAAAYEFTDSTVLKASYQEGFIYPCATAFYDWAYFSHEHELAGFGPLSNLTPEHMYSTEVTLHQEIKPARVMMDLTGYYNIYKNLQVWKNYSTANADVNAVVNAPRYNWWMGAAANAEGVFRSVGFEFATSWSPIEAMVIRASYGWSRPSELDKSVQSVWPVVTNNRDQWLNFPTHLVKLNIINKFFNEKLITAVNMNLSSGYDVPDATQYMDPTYQKHRFVTNIAATYAVTKNFSVKFAIENLFGNHVPQVNPYYGTPYSGAAGQEKRFYYLTAKYSF